MTTTNGPALALDPATRSNLLQTIVDCLPHTPNAPEAERTTLRDAAFALAAALAPTDPVEAVFAAHIIAAHYACMNAYRCAARPDLPPALHVRYQAQAASLSRLTTSKRRELLRHQAAQPALPAALGAARAAQAQATAQNAPARPAAPAPQPKAAAAQRPATPAPAAAPTRVEASPEHAAIDQFLAKLAAASQPADDDDDAQTLAEVAQIVANAHVVLADITPAPADMGARLQAEVDARKAAATQLAA